MIYVAGSGPSGIACVHTLLKAGHQVTMIDVGIGIEDDSRQLVDAYHRNPDKDELICNIRQLRKKYGKQSDVQPVKTLFGSDYPYKVIDDTYVTTDDKAVVRSSLAKGGFSTVWGANVSCVVQKDIDDWPITNRELNPYYSTLEEIMDISSVQDEMSDIFPVNIGKDPAYPLGKQGCDLYESLRNSRSTLAGNGIHIGRALLAIGPKYSRDGKGCTPCGLCMHGCPNRAIFNSEFVLEKLQQDKNFTYLPGKVVLRYSDENEEVEIHVKDVHTGDVSTLRGSRLFLACGVINTTAIIARSLNILDHTFTIKDSQKYIFPLIRWQRSRGCINEKENTADQIYMEIDNDSVSQYIAHLQYYGYNDLFLDPVRVKLGQATEYIPRLFSSFFERLMLCFVYLHSEDSGTMSLKVHSLDNGSNSMGEIKGHFNRRSDAVMKSILQLLNKHRSALGCLPLGLGLQTTLPGDSQHIGSTLPMAKTPGKYETDLLGRPAGKGHVHVVDSSILPSVPATPITPTVMVNAIRIADAVSRHEGI